MKETKKVLLFVVEGPSEELAFGVLFSRLFADQRVMFDVVHGDITTRHSYRGGTRRGGEPNARNRLQDQIVQHIARQPYEWKDLLRIVHIVDTDGALVDDSCVKEQSGIQGVRYAAAHMTTGDKPSICDRNRRKRKALAQLCSCDALTYQGRQVPYSVYYLSRNMEHALHDRIDDVDDKEKELLARRFQMRFKNDLGGFSEFLLSEELAVAGGYADTWSYIGEECHSLERHSNLHLVLPE